jgi:hypothetical protein
LDRDHLLGAREIHHNARTMDETPEELERLKREAEAIDPYKYRRRGRAMAAILIGALGAGVVWAVLEGIDRARNPCERVRDYLCGKDPRSPECRNYHALVEESVKDPNAESRGMLRGQCERKIARLKDEDGVTVP